MGVTDFLLGLSRDVRENGATGARIGAEELSMGLLTRLGLLVNHGVDVFEHDWDLLVVLDGCRWDLMTEVVDEYDYVESARPVMSCASQSREWLQKTFMDPPRGIDRFRTTASLLREPANSDLVGDRWRMDPDRAGRTAYVTWNVFAEFMDTEWFGEYVLAGRDAWGEDTALVPPRAITDQTIRVLRESDHERTIAHYMQPHAPFRTGDTTEVEGTVWQRIQRGEKDREEAWSEYRDNLRWVLDDLEMLLENVDAENVVVTSDHGNAIGRFGCYGHRLHVPVPAIKRVPWLTATATETGSYEPGVEVETEAVASEDVKKRLEQLGYRG
jgi:hypothetical protein